MYVGHVGAALGAKGLRSALPLWALIIASQLPDWADASVCLAGISSSTPGMYSHSFPAIGVLTMLGSVVYLITTRDLAGAAIVGALVISHALGDYVTGLKPTWSGGPMVGLQLYRYPALDFVAEAVVILLGWMVYRTSFTKERQASREVQRWITVKLDFVAEAVVILLGWMVYRTSFTKERQASREVWTILGVLLAIQAVADIVFSLSPSLRKC